MNLGEKGRSVCKRQLDTNDREYQGREFIREYFNTINFDFLPVENDLDFYYTGKTEGIGDVKAYLNSDNPRSIDKFKDYQIDYSKLEKICNAAEKENRTPLLICVFSDVVAVWDLSKIPWRDRIRYKEANYIGVEYGQKKKMKKESYLYKNETIYCREWKK